MSEGMQSQEEAVGRGAYFLHGVSLLITLRRDLQELLRYRPQRLHLHAVQM